MLRVFYVAVPVEEEAMEDGDSSSRKQCIVSISPKTWKVWAIYDFFGFLCFFKFELVFVILYEKEVLDSNVNFSFLRS